MSEFKEISAHELERCLMTRLHEIIRVVVDFTGQYDLILILTLSFGYFFMAMDYWTFRFRLTLWALWVCGLCSVLLTLTKRVLPKFAWFSAAEKETKAITELFWPAHC